MGSGWGKREDSGNEVFIRISLTLLMVGRFCLLFRIIVLAACKFQLGLLLSS